METDNRKRIRNVILEYGLLLLTGVVFYFFTGNEWLNLTSDSPGYIDYTGGEGIMPLYPAFLRLMKAILGEKYYLDGAVIVQSMLAVVCTMIFVVLLKRRFDLKLWEELLLYVACMLPFSIYLPEFGITHQIMTEGLTYSLFYLFFVAIIEAVWTVEYKWYLASMVMAFILGITRSQMLFLQAICLLALLWITLKKITGSIWRKVGICFAVLITGVVFAFGAYKVSYTIVAFDSQHQPLRERAESRTEGSVNVNENSDEVRGANSQFVTIIMSRGFYEADREDADLFQDEMMRKIFERTYELADSEGKLHNHAVSGLYMWRTLVYDRMQGYALQAIDEYDTLHPGDRVRDTSSIVRELGLRVLIKHFDRYIYHTIRLMLPSFIASVFFQVESIYLLCHLITLFLYIFATAGCGFVYRRGLEPKCAEFMATVLCMLIIMVVSSNLLFVGLQRYVVYGMGIFYCALYLLCKEILIIIQQRKINRAKESGF